MELPKQKQERAKSILRLLKKEFPNAQCPLTFETPLELLIKTILSAQCTDARVNLVGQTLFKKYRSAEDFVRTPAEELENDIRSTGFFRNKTRNIQACCRVLIEKHNGQVPQTLEELTELQGVGRKTANVILGTIFDTPGVVVDTHVIRISNLLKLTRHMDPVKIESDLMTVISKKDWMAYSHLIANHGRKTCIARRPQCHACKIAVHCPSAAV